MNYALPLVSVHLSNFFAYRKNCDIPNFNSLFALLKSGKSFECLCLPPIIRGILWGVDTSIK